MARSGNRARKRKTLQQQRAHAQRMLRLRLYGSKLRHFLATLLTLVLVLLITAIIGIQRMFVGPSRTVSEALTISLIETSALKFVPRLFLRPETVDDILLRAQVVEPEAEIDTSLITIASSAPSHEAEPTDPDGDGIEIHPITGGTYRGYMMVVADPSRVFVGVSSANFTMPGLMLDGFCEKYKALGGINGGGFEDENGRGNGGVPVGMVISEGTGLHGASGSTVVGFDANHILHVGKYTNAQAQALGLRDAVAWGPALVVNGEPAEVSDTATGLNPRTAIGQRADGAVLMLVVDGRHANSLGATYSDLIDVMLDYGAVNACNLDGGSSSVLYFNGERVSDIAPLTGSRRVPTAFLVR